MVGPRGVDTQSKSRPRSRIGLFRMAKVGVALPDLKGTSLAHQCGPTKDHYPRWPKLFINLLGAQPLELFGAR